MSCKQCKKLRILIENSSLLNEQSEGNLLAVGPVLKKPSVKTLIDQLVSDNLKIIMANRMAGKQDNEAVKRAVTKRSDQTLKKLLKNKDVIKAATDAAKKAGKDSTEQVVLSLRTIQDLAIVLVFGYAIPTAYVNADIRTGAINSALVQLANEGQVSKVEKCPAGSSPIQSEEYPKGACTSPEGKIVAVLGENKIKLSIIKEDKAKALRFIPNFIKNLDDTFTNILNAASKKGATEALAEIDSLFKKLTSSLDTSLRTTMDSVRLDATTKKEVFKKLSAKVETAITNIDDAITNINNKLNLGGVAPAVENNLKKQKDELVAFKEYLVNYKNDLDYFARVPDEQLSRARTLKVRVKDIPAAVRSLPETLKANLGKNWKDYAIIGVKHAGFSLGCAYAPVLLSTGAVLTVIAANTGIGRTALQALLTRFQLRGSEKRIKGEKGMPIKRMVGYALACNQGALIGSAVSAEYLTANATNTWNKATRDAYNILKSNKIKSVEANKLLNKSKIRQASESAYFSRFLLPVPTYFIDMFSYYITGRTSDGTALNYFTGNVEPIKIGLRTIGMSATFVEGLYGFIKKSNLGPDQKKRLARIVTDLKSIIPDEVLNGASLFYLAFDKYSKNKDTKIKEAGGFGKLFTCYLSIKIPKSILLKTIKSLEEKQGVIEGYIATAQEITETNDTIYKMLLKLEEFYLHLKNKKFNALQIITDCKNNQAKLKKDFPDLFKTPKPKPKNVKIERTPPAPQGTGTPSAPQGSGTPKKKEEEEEDKLLDKV